MKKLFTMYIEKMKGKNRAFTLFVSLLVASLLLAIGFSVGNILLKQLLLSSSGSGTQVAFYAADSAAECTLFWDRKDTSGYTLSESPFGTTTPTDLRLICGAGSAADGGGLVYGFNKVCDDGLCGPGATQATSTFYIDFRDPDDAKYMACAFVTVGKRFDPATGAESTVIDARGYNTDLLSDGSGGYGYGYGTAGTGGTSCNLERPRVVERGLLLTF